MVAFLTRMPAGIPGMVNRGFASTVEPVSLTPFGVTGRPTTYGVPLVVDQTGGNVGNMRTVVAADTADLVYGLLVRPFPTTGANANDPLGTGTIAQQQNSGDVLRFGYMSVLLSGSTAAVKGGNVYIWTAAPSGSHITGGFESTNPGASGIAIPGVFMGPADANGNVEVSLNLIP